MATDFRNSRWRRPPSWKIHFRLNRHYEKGTPGLLLPIENITFVGLSWRLRVVYLEGSNAEAISAANRQSPKTGRNFGVFWAGDPQKWIWRLQTPKRHVYETEHVVWAIKRVNRLKIATCRRDEETEKKIYIKKGEQKSQKCDISPLCGGAPCEPISTKFGVFVGLTNVITCAKIGFKISIGFSRPTGGKTQVSL